MNYMYSFASSEYRLPGVPEITARSWSSYTSGEMTVAAKRYNHKYIAENVYNDIIDLVYLLYRLDVTPLGGRNDKGGMNSFLFAMMMQSASGNFTRMANEQQYAESEALRP